MKYRKFRYDKLCRDKTVDRHEENGSRTDWRELSSEEFVEHLKLKLIEEAQEVCAARTEDELHEELADLIEVICAFADLEKVMQIKDKKYQIRGGFEGRRFIITAEHPEGSAAEKYCSANSDKYPEITS
jgi:predicted house-cleaning noncanonical NTP pyrophosphatase (MazG superfamily)